MGESGALRKVNPHQLLKFVTSSYDSGLLRVFSNSVAWSIYVYQGKIIYASHSVAAFERLSCHLSRLHYQYSLSVEKVLSQLNRIEIESKNRLTQTPEYEAICSLVIQGYLDKTQANFLIERLTKEAIQSFLLIRVGNYELLNGFEILPKFCELDVSITLNYCQEQVNNWQSLGPEIWSPYQRPRLVSRVRAESELAVEEASELNGMLKGQISFYHLAAMFNHDELQLAKKLQPYITKKLVALGEPLLPFNQLPKLNRDSDVALSNTKPHTDSLQKTRAKHRKIYTIAFVDDSPSMLKQISRYLADESFTPVPIEQPLKALMQILRHKPDVILLDIQMEQLDGYELCKCLRNNSVFKQTPIIMVTGNSGIIDRVRAKLVGASGYLTKPFNQAELLTTVFKYLH